MALSQSIKKALQSYEEPREGVDEDMRCLEQRFDVDVVVINGVSGISSCSFRMFQEFCAETIVAIIGSFSSPLTPNQYYQGFELTV